MTLGVNMFHPKSPGLNSNSKFDNFEIRMKSDEEKIRIKFAICNFFKNLICNYRDSRRTEDSHGLKTHGSGQTEDVFQQTLASHL